MLEIIILYSVIINIVGVYIMWSDKRKAIKHVYRIPEKTLFLIALLGGAMGCILGMQIFRHKTRHWQFTIGMPAILISQICFMILYINR